ncbi:MULTISPECIES: hypothetical protein [Streptomyces]|uniref:Aromatic ring-opening dioxygenase LigA n=1 Tax=Streptomyces luteosporeus TaxID=173856 RepID=A0ABN3TY28_9ACTN
MTHVLAPSRHSAPGTARRLLRAVAVLACAPYLTLKVAWLCGSRAGIPDGSPLLTGGAMLNAINAATVAMDLCVIVLALLLTRPWGTRVPAWLLVLPMYGAAGLLTPIMVGFPAQLLLRAVGAGHGATPAKAAEPFLADWVFRVVYGGFIAQGLCLGALFALYARDRWGHLWRGRAGEAGRRARGRGERLPALAAVALAPLPLVVHLLWATGSTVGLPADIAAGRHAEAAVLDAAFVLAAAAAAAGLLQFLRRRGGGWRLRTALLCTAVPSAALSCWGGWLIVAALTATDRHERAATPLMLVTYAVQVIIGLLVLAAGARYFTRRTAAAPARTR